MVQAAERMKAMRQRPRTRGLRELRLIVPDARSKAVLRQTTRSGDCADRRASNGACIGGGLPDDFRRGRRSGLSSRGRTQHSETVCARDRM